MSLVICWLDNLVGHAAYAGWQLWVDTLAVLVGYAVSRSMLLKPAGWLIWLCWLAG
jgi:hypothetical protein